jgi:hypothetical protein
MQPLFAPYDNLILVAKSLELKSTIYFFGSVKFIQSLTTEGCMHDLEKCLREILLKY